LLSALARKDGSAARLGQFLVNRLSRLSDERGLLDRQHRFRALQLTGQAQQRARMVPRGGAAAADDRITFTSTFLTS